MHAVGVYSQRDRCNSIHMPAQSGSSKVLEAMRRGYTREAYLDLVHLIREVRHPPKAVEVVALTCWLARPSLASRCLAISSPASAVRRKKITS